ncbi:MAG: M48 family metallopeptidase [Verrucomicrobia bacterium]|nr:M48 family metallopeptidase [Verrucomicrobiota bacterium]
MKTRLLLLVVATGALLANAGCYTNPVTGRQSLMLISQGHELSLGAESFAQMRKTEKVSTDPGQNARVKRVGERIAGAVGDQLPNAKWEFVVFESKDVNAFALPGGKVGVYTGLLKLAENDSELAIVMGHEIGHVIARHGAERMSEGMVIAGVGALGGVVAESKYDARTRDLFLLAYGGATTVGRVLPHSRNNESEADRMGAIYAARAGYDPRGAITFWKKMAAQKETGKSGAKLPAWLSTHPADAKRVADLEAFMPQVVPVYEANKGRFQ